MFHKLLNKIFEKRRTFSLILGIAAILLIIFGAITQRTSSYSKLYIKLIGCIAGLMQILDGLNQVRTSKNRTLGLSSVMIGVILMILGFLIPELFLDS